MIQGFLTALPEQRRQVFTQATLRSGVPQQLMEHDWWQSFVLKAIFRLPIAPYLTLHGSRCLRPQ